MGGLIYEVGEAFGNAVAEGHFFATPVGDLSAFHIAVDLGRRFLTFDFAD